MCGVSASELGSWEEVCQALALPPFVFSTAVAWGRTLAARFSEPHRHYHTVRHIAGGACGSYAVALW